MMSVWNTTEMARADSIIAAKDAEIARLRGELEYTKTWIGASVSHVQKGAILARIRRVLSASPAPDPAGAWPPADCHDTRSCAHHGECMYVGCPHSKWKLKSPDPAAATAAIKGKGDLAAKTLDECEEIARMMGRGAWRPAADMARSIADAIAALRDKGDEK